VLAEADVALVAAGTATLEAGVLGVPTQVAVRLNPLSAAVGRRLVRTPHVALPNVLLGREVMAESIQDLGALSADLAALIRGLPEASERARQDALALRAELGGPGFASRVADFVLRLPEAHP